MKKAMLFLLYLIPVLLFAQKEQVLFDRVRVRGGFGAPIAELTSVNNQAGVFAGGGGAVILNDFFIGGFGQGGDFAEHTSANGRLYPVNFSYGGLWLGYVHPTLKVVHFFGSLKIGGGAADINLDRDNTAHPLFSETVFVIQPEAGVEVNLFRWFRLALTGNYRVVSGIQPKNLDGLTSGDFSSAGMALTFRFGKFYRAD